MRLHRLVRMVEDLAHQRGVSNTVVRHQLAQLHIDTEVRLTGLRASPTARRTTWPRGLIQKTGLLPRVRGASRRTDPGSCTQLAKGSKHAVADGHWTFQSLFARRYGIAGGTDQIQLNIIGERQLGLPK